MHMPLLAPEVAIIRPTRPQPIRRQLANAVAEALATVWALRFHVVAAGVGVAAAVAALAFEGSLS